MPISFMPEHDVTPEYAIFGKTASFADYIRINVTHPVVQEFDSLIHASLSQAVRQPGWNLAAYFEAGVSEIQYTSRDRRWCLIGGMQPSRDASGRLYPFVLGIVLPASAVTPWCAELSIANEAFFIALRDKLRTITDVAALTHFMECWAVPHPDAQSECDLAQQIFERHLQSPVSRLWKSQSGFDDCLFSLLFHAAGPKRLPLSDSPGEDVLDQATWLAIYRAVAGKNLLRLPDYVRRANTLTVISGRLNEQCLSTCWGLSAPSDTEGAAPLTPRNPAQMRAAYELGRKLQDPDFNLASLVSTIKRIAEEAA